MLFDGDAIKVQDLGEGLVELCFGRKGESVNKLDRLAFGELRGALEILAKTPDLKGVLVTSAKDVFIVGADIFEFVEVFGQEPEDVAAFAAGNAAIMTALSDLPAPSVAVINGLALGGGFEVALAADYRVMSSAAKVGLPEVTLGIFPGYGGTVRLPRLIGLAEAAQWIISGAQQTAETALEQGAVDAVGAPAELRGAALSLLRHAIASPAEWQERRRRADRSVGVGENAGDLLKSARANAAKALPHYPAAHDAVDLLEAGAALDRDAALALEAEQFAKTARSQAAGSLVAIFVNEQALKKIGKQYAKTAAPVRAAAVIGAGVMGAGIAYQSALRGVPAILKDVSEKAVEGGVAEAKKLLAKSVEQGRLKQEKADAVLAAIAPQLSFEGFDKVDVVIEAIVENLAVKTKVFR
jgi:3-hydroxyacyl-CoA dehydrogenase / enoyl-CoA hydratase / 3-hydroxybutyryl-CoA epimerase / enoyl-CoA isomerase